MIKLKKLLKESEGLSAGEKFGLKEVGEQIVQTHKQLNELLFKYMNGVKKYHSKHRKSNPELAKKLEYFYKHLKGSYYYTTKQAAGKYLSNFQKTVEDLTEGKLTEYRIRGNADELLIRKGDIKKGMMVWFTKDGRGAQKLKVKYTMLSKDGKEEHYITNKGTFTPRDVVGY